MEVGLFSIFCCFKIAKMGVSRFSLRCMVPLVKVIQDFQAKLGVIRGLWSDPWCIVGDFSSFVS